jgi:hypothetical protein
MVITIYLNSKGTTSMLHIVDLAGFENSPDVVRAFDEKADRNSPNYKEQRALVFRHSAQINHRSLTWIFCSRN